ncbi:MAG: hypothetical protein EPN25_06130 [Nitrospirae bacterium]|nr:MAG: hypothetical protein EPN25_06130 [Nitrospirota bacterium]
MDDPKRRVKKTALLLAPLLVAAIVFGLLRGPNVSNALKKGLLPELELMLGRKVIAQKIYLNIFPLFIEARGLKVFDEKGERLLTAQRVKAYADISGLFNRQLTLRRLVIKEPEIVINRKQAEDIEANVRKYLAMTRKDALKVKVLAVEVQHGSADYRDEEAGLAALLKGFDAEALLSEEQKLRASAEQITVKKKGLPDISAGVSVAMLLRKNAIEIRKLVVSSFGSQAIGSGNVEQDKGLFRIDLSLLAGTLKKIFNLGTSGEGSVEVLGLVNYAGKKLVLDLKVKGNFYIQALMELLSVKERVEGKLSLKGVIKGPLDDLTAAGDLELSSGNLFDVEVDSLKAGVSYAKGTMHFLHGAGRFYNGTASVTASIALPVVNYYTLKVDFLNVDSKPLFKLIGWDPGIEPGKVKGSLLQAGADFNPEGVFEYRSLRPGSNVIGRVRDISGKYRMQGDLVTLPGLRLSTGLSEVAMSGTADLKAKALDFEGRLTTQDVRDLSSPYYRDLLGSGEFSGSITGPFLDPVLTGRLRISNPKIREYAAGSLSAAIRYRKNLLNVSEMSVTGGRDDYSMSGSVHFRKAEELFDLSDPEYDLTAQVRNAELGAFARLFYDDFKGTGLLKTEVLIRGRGTTPDISGKAVIDNAEIYGLPLDLAVFGWSYKDTKLMLSTVRLKKGKSFVRGSGSIDAGGRFSFEAGSERVHLSDLLNLEIKGDAVFSASATGSGSLEKHTVTVKADMIEGRLRDKPLGPGTLSAELKDRAFTLRAGLLSNRMKVLAGGRLEKEIPWEATVEVLAGRYDPLISAFLKDVPEDLILSLTGAISLHGDRSNIRASSVVKQLNLSMYNYSFTNESDIRLELDNRKLHFDKIVLRSGNASLKLDGSMEIGKKYDLVLEGNSSLMPFKSLSNKIGVLRGDAEFVLNVTGDWEKPMINGGVNVTNGTFSLKDYAHRLSSLNGYLYMDNDRVVLEKLTGRFGGGDIDLSGVLYLKKFSINRFYVEANMSNITTAISKDFSLNYGGNLLYKGSMTDQIVTGDIRINRARYRERVEWKSWLLKTRQAEKLKTEISGLEKSALNVRISGKDNIHIDNNVARADVSVDLLLRGSFNRPVLYGRAESREGTVYFRNNEFRILHASADFSDPTRTNPLIAIAAETIVKGYKIKMNLEGQLNQFNMSLSSDPVLKEMDILALLTVGQTGGQLKGLEGGVGAGEATSFVTGKLQDVVEERLKYITGLDRFQVDPHVSRTTGTVEPRVTVSKRLLGEKMFVTFASAVNSAEEQIIKLEYFLNKNTSLIGIRDERGIIGGDIKFRFEFK